MPVLPRGAWTTIGRASGPAVSGILPSLDRIRPARPAGRVTVSGSSSLDASWTTTDVSTSHPSIEEDIADGRHLTGQWLVTATARLTAAYMNVAAGELRVHVAGHSNSRPGPFVSPGADTLDATCTVPGIVAANAMTVGCDFASTVSLTDPDNAIDTLLTLTVTAYKLGN